mgnify:CR=1 FL=1
MSADNVDFISAMDTVWSALNALTELADTLERATTVTPSHVDLACTTADALSGAYRAIKDGGDFAGLFAGGGSHA